MKIAKEKIAIVGMSFRLPGAHLGNISNSAAFWQALLARQDLVTEIGPDRWDSSLFYHPDPSTPGKSYVFAAGQLTDIDQFDAQFFGISPREAAQMDPQQRLLLELCWEALANGGQRVDRLEGSDCAVYIGVASSDYANRAVDDLAAADAYTMTGNTGSIASNRISYQFNFKGPSVSVDTACSSSLVAVHEACKSLWSGESSCAITGGVNMLLHPSPFVGFSKASMLSPTGRCKPFDASADGYVRSEGAGILFLKRLADAERDGDPIHAVIVNAGVNSDGRTPSGISVPDQQGQADLLQKLYRDEGQFDLNELDYLEAHGTGTAVGDPIEAASIGSVLGQWRSHNHALPIGSVKGNVGHLETASGMAGIIKVIHCLKERAIPPTNQLNKPNPAIDFDDLNLQLVTEQLSLAHIQRPLKMGVNSFGFGGTNAHVVVEEYQSQTPTPAANAGHDNHIGAVDSRKPASAPASLPPLYLTANSEAALKDLAREYAALIEAQPTRYYDIAINSLTRQSRLSRGLLLAINSDKTSVSQSMLAQIVLELKHWAAGTLHSHAVTGTSDTEHAISLKHTGVAPTQMPKADLSKANVSKANLSKDDAPNADIAKAEASKISAASKVSAANRVADNRVADNKAAAENTVGACALYTGKRLPGASPVVFVYSGNGCQWQGMARQLYQCDAIFRAYIDDLEQRFIDLIDFSIVDELMASEPDSHMHLTDYAQPLLFAIQVAITRWFADKGLIPDLVLGHSVGEVAAAWAGGALTLDDAVLVIVARSHAQALTRGTGRMAAAGLSPKEAQALIAELELSNAVEIACYNTRDSVVLAGALPKLAKVQAYCEQQQRFYRLLDLDYAFHSRYMDPIQKPLLQSLANLQSRPSSRFISSVDPAAHTLASSLAKSPSLDADYWWRNIREPVLFSQAMDIAIEHGGRLFIEIGSQPILQHYINHALRSNQIAGAALSTLNRKASDPEAIQRSLYQSFLAGAEIDFATSGIASVTDLPVAGQSIALPAYPWQRSRHWYKSSPESDSVVERRCVHPLLGYRLNASLPIWEQQCDTRLTEYLADHIVDADVIMPGAAYVELALAACRDWFGFQQFDIENIDIVAPMVLADDEQRTLRVELALARQKFTVSSRARFSTDSWLVHCTGKINTPTEKVTATPVHHGAQNDLQKGYRVDENFWQRHPALLANSGAYSGDNVSDNNSSKVSSNDSSIDSSNSDSNNNTNASNTDGSHTDQLQSTSIDAQAFYARLAAYRLNYGPHFQALEKLWSTSDSSVTIPTTVFAQLKADTVAACDDNYILHPVLLDACFQLSALLVDTVEQTFLPVRVGRLQCFAKGQVALIAAKRIKQTERSLLVDFVLSDIYGRRLAMASGCRFKAMPVAATAVVPQHYCWQPSLSHRRLQAGLLNGDNTHPIDKSFGQWHSSIVSDAGSPLQQAADNEYFNEVKPLFDQLIAYAAVDIFRHIADRQQRFSIAEQLLTGVIVEQQRDFFENLIDIALQDGLIVALDGGQYAFSDKLAEAESRMGVYVADKGIDYLGDGYACDTSTANIWRLLLEDYPAYIEELTQFVAAHKQIIDSLAQRQSINSDFHIDAVRITDAKALVDLPAALSTASITQSVTQSISASLAKWQSYARLQQLNQRALGLLINTRTLQHNIDVLELAIDGSDLAEHIVPQLLDNDSYHLCCGDNTMVSRLNESLMPYTAFSVEYVESLVLEDCVENLVQGGCTTGSYTTSASTTSASTTSAYTANRYDAIVVTASMSRSRQPEQLLVQLQALLKPGGVLLIAGQSATRMHDFIMGVEPSWWSRSRPDARYSQLLGAAALKHALSANTQHSAIVYAGGQAQPDSDYLVLAQKPMRTIAPSTVIAKSTIRTLPETFDEALDETLDEALNEDPKPGEADETTRPVWLMLVSEQGRARLQQWWQTVVEQQPLASQIELVMITLASPQANIDELAPIEMLGLNPQKLTVTRAEPDARSDSGALLFAGSASLPDWQEIWASLPTPPRKIIDASFICTDSDILAKPNTGHKLQIVGESIIESAFATHRCDTLVSLLQFISSQAEDQNQSLAGLPELDLLTFQSRCNPVDAAIWGMGRVAMNEYPNLALRLIDIDAHALTGSADLLFNELVSRIDAGNSALAATFAASDARLSRRHSDTAEPAIDSANDSAKAESEVLLMQGARYVNRWRPRKPSGDSQSSGVEAKLGSANMSRQSKNRQTRYLGFKQAGQLNHLQWFSRQEPGLGSDQVAVAPKFAGLNFRDVMYASGLLPDEALENGFSGATLGMEFSGVVTAVGSAVSELTVGDEVMGFAPGCFADAVVTERFAVAKKPQHWSFEAAATVPTVFFTAYYALVHLARLQAGERVLIHGAAGGVGLAAIQIAQACGAEVFATAGTDDKRSIVALLGASHVFDSRSLDFADQIAALCDGVDVVLNSLAGEAITRSLTILRPFGRFLELGKRDFYADSAMGLRPFRNNIAYFGIDADQLMLVQPALVQSLFTQLLALFEREELKPIPYRVFSADRSVDAFRYMQRAKQIGKVLLDLASIPTSDADNPVVNAGGVNSANQTLQLSAQATYLVTGGSSGLGLATVNWLLSRGARHIAVVSRSGLADSQVSALQAQGQDVNIIDIRVDLASPDCERQLAQALTGQPPLRGIVHAATVIEDALLQKMSPGSVTAVLGPKANGAMALHKLSLSLAAELAFFVLYSSATTDLGNPGQANYVAANSYLEALSRMRRQQGLPSLCLGWGVIDDVGFLARNAHLKQALVNRLGGYAMHSGQVLAVLESALLEAAAGESPAIDSSYLALDWSSVHSLLPAAKQAKYQYFNRTVDTTAHGDPADLKLRLAALPVEQRSEVVYQMLAAQVEKILCLPSEDIDIEQSLFEQGMDSLMGVELAAAIETHFSVQISALALSEGPTIRRIGDNLLRQMQLADANGSYELPQAGMQEKLNLLVERHTTEKSGDNFSGIKSNVIQAAGEHYDG